MLALNVCLSLIFLIECLSFECYYTNFASKMAEQSYILKGIYLHKNKHSNFL